jgi:hypothetical protein
VSLCSLWYGILILVVKHRTTALWDCNHYSLTNII